MSEYLRLDVRDQSPVLAWQEPIPFERVDEPDEPEAAS